MVALPIARHTSAAEDFCQGLRLHAQDHPRFRATPAAAHALGYIDALARTTARSSDCNLRAHAAPAAAGAIQQYRPRVGHHTDLWRAARTRRRFYYRRIRRDADYRRILRRD